MIRLYNKKIENFRLVFRYSIRVIKSFLFTIKKLSFPISNPDAAIVVFTSSFFYWCGGDSGLKDRIAFKSLIISGFRPILIFNDIAKIPKSVNLVIINPHHRMFSKRNTDGKFSEELSHLFEKVESKGINLIPSSKDILFLENKRYMHQALHEHKIKQPKTEILRKRDCSYENLKDTFGDKFIIKTLDGSGSDGVFLIKNFEEFRSAKIDYFICQEFLNITFDLRVIMTCGRVESFYWRKSNVKNGKWRPTSTSHGSRVDFYDLPKSAEKLCSEIYQKLNVFTFGADICWKNDDLSTEPIVLEFSPTYQPNPNPKGLLSTDIYHQFKKNTVFLYEEQFEKLIFVLFYNQLVHIKKSIKS